MSETAHGDNCSKKKAVVSQELASEKWTSLHWTHAAEIDHAVENERQMKSDWTARVEVDVVYSVKTCKRMGSMLIQQYYLNARDITGEWRFKINNCSNALQAVNKTMCGLEKCCTFLKGASFRSLRRTSVRISRLRTLTSTRMSHLTSLQNWISLQVLQWRSIYG